MPQRRHSKPTSKRTSQPPSKPAVSIIGAGRLGTALGISLKSAGYPIETVVAKGAASAKRAARLIGGSTQGVSFSQLKSAGLGALAGSHLLIISTPDDAIAKVTTELADMHSPTAGAAKGVRVALHTSGALSSEVLRPLQRHKFATGALHPLISVSEPRVGAEWIKRAYFSVEGDTAATQVARRIVRDLGARMISVTPEMRALYHAAAVMASPNMTALFDIAVEMLNRCGVSSGQARKVLMPLVQSTLNNLASQAPAFALTGTFKRRDVATVRKHITAIESQKLSDALLAYAILGRHSLTLTSSKADRRATEIKRILRGVLKKAQ